MRGYFSVLHREERSWQTPKAIAQPPAIFQRIPGVYRFRDPHGRVIYVGKAKKPAQPTEQLLCSPRTSEPENLRYGAYCRQCGVDGSRQ